MNLRMFRRHSFLLPLVAFYCAGLASAQIELTGSISDDTTGPLLSGQVYHLNGGVSLPAGKTLTVQAGAIVKGRPNSQLVTQGTLLVNGAPGNPAIFTSYSDDVGGDTNLDGASTGTPADWRGIYMYPSSSASVYSHVEVRFSGGGNGAGIEITGGGVQLDAVDISSGSRHGINLNGNTAVITGCSFTGNGGLPMQSVPLQTLPNFTGNTATGNAEGDYARITTFTHSADLTISPSNCIGGVLVIGTTTFSVAAGKRLTLTQGLIVKIESTTHLVSQGFLDVLGTELEPVVFTTLADDSVGGDTASDGATVGTPGSWRGFYFYPSASTSRIEHAEIKFTGNGNYGAVTFGGAVVSVDGCNIHQSSTGGIDFSGGSVGSTVSNSTIHDNVGLPIYNCPLQAVPGLLDNTASGNQSGDYIRVTSYSHSQDFEVQLANVLNGVLVVSTTQFSVPVGKRMTLGEGLIIKMESTTNVISQGELVIAGTPGAPVIITTLDDDEIGGDTAKDGATTGTPGSWRGLYFYPTAVGSTVDFAVLRYTGNGNYAGISLNTVGISITNSIVEKGSSAALHQLGGAGGAVVAGCTFRDNGGIAATNISVNSLEHFRDNIALGNAGGNHTQVTNPTPVGDVVLGAENVIGDLLHLTTGINVGAASSITFGEGMIIKVNPAIHLTCISGGLHFEGTAEAPIILTSFYDDNVVGDSDLGVGPPASAGDWRGFYTYPSANLTLRHTKIYYVGNGNYAGLDLNAANAVLDHVEVRHATQMGFDIKANVVTDPTHLTAFDCGTRGISLTNGSCTLRRSTAANCGTEGIYRAPAFTGRVVDTLSYGNTVANFSGFGPGALRYCNGSAAHAGSKGNIDMDPLFVDQSGGDLNLQVSSPCIDAANPQSMTDPDGSRADIGSYYFDFTGPTPYCGSKLNSLGCLPAIDWTGEPTLGGSDDFHVTATNIVGQQPGYLLSSLSFNSGTKNGLGASLLGTHFCAFNPKFLVSTSSGGSAGTCTGTFDVHYSQALMGSEGLLVGQTVYTQYVYKDPAHPDGSGWGHTNALRFQIAP